METNPSHLDPITLEDQRRYYLRRSLCDAQAEFGHLESSQKILESALLTAMGVLGADCGFNGMLQPGANGIKVVGRGMDSTALALIKDNFHDLVNQHVCASQASSLPYYSDIQILSESPRPSFPLTRAKIRILVGWRMEKELTGLMGLGGKIRDTPYLDKEIDFLYNLMDHMMAAIRSIAANSVIHTLKNELDQARQRATEWSVRNEAAKKELEETLFRLSGFNDIFNELSGLKESDHVLDTFLLVMLGIFSAQNGTILYWDDASGKSHTTYRGLEKDKAPGVETAVVRKTLAAVSESLQGNNLGLMQATLVPVERLNSLRLPSPQKGAAIFFKVDPVASGLLFLGKRLVGTQYGIKERELLLALTHTFLAFLKNSKSFETIQELNAEQKQKNRALKRTVQELSESRRTIAGLEKTGEQIKAAIAKAMARAARASIMDIVLILISGAILGLVYNFASPSGIPVVSPILGYPPSPIINIDDTQALLKSQTIILIDARPVEFYKQRHIRGALNLPVALFDFVYMMRFSQTDPQRPIVVYGRNISRHYDAEIAHRLKERGHSNISILSGGFNAWQAKGFALSP
jgi:rhodanese-related sulfurtransferase